MEKIVDIINKINVHFNTRGGLKQVYFVACGGSLAAMYPAKYLLKNESTTFMVGMYNSNEFVHALPKALGNNSLVILTSTKATPETVEAIKKANEQGAVTIGLTGYIDSLTAHTAQHSLVYNHQDEWNTDSSLVCTNSQSIALKLSFEILHQFESYEHYDKAIEAFSLMGDIYKKASKKIRDDKIAFAIDYQNDEVFNVIGSGTLYASAYMNSFCYLQEMQHRHSVPVHSGEYFHGPFETTNKFLPIMLLTGIGRTRPLDERVLRFLNKFARRVTILDAAELGLSELHEHVAEYFNVTLIHPLSKQFFNEMANLRQHPMTYRRYMWKTDY